MALIECPNCGHQISDKATKCPNCSTELNFDETLFCKECGTKIDSGSDVCSNCGCPVEDRITTRSLSSKQTELKNDKPLKAKNKAKTKLILIASVVILFLALAISIGIKQYTAKEYHNNLELASIAIIKNYTESENICFNVLVVWHNSIYHIKDSSTDKYTRMNKGDGQFYDDFNTAIENFYGDSSIINKIDNIYTENLVISDLMGSLQSPPSKYKEVYAKLQIYYDTYINMMNLAMNTGGNSYNTYNSTFWSCFYDQSDALKKMPKYID